MYECFYRNGHWHWQNVKIEPEIYILPDMSQYQLLLIQVERLHIGGQSTVRIQATAYEESGVGLKVVAQDPLSPSLAMNH